MTSERQDRVGHSRCSRRRRNAASAQQRGDRMTAWRSAMPTSYRPAECEIKPNHFKVSSGAELSEVRHRDRRAREQDPHPGPGREGPARGDAAERPGQEPGGLVLPRPDLPAAGRSLRRRIPRSRKAEQLAPDCAKDIDELPQERLGRRWSRRAASSRRRRTPTPRSRCTAQAGAIYRGSPIAFYQTAAILNDKGQPDSAAYYFGQAAAVAANAKDTTEIKVRNRSAFNQGALLLNARSTIRRPCVVRAVPQVGAERHRSQARPGRGVPRTAARSSRRRRWRRSSSPPGGAPAPAAPAAGAGARRTS